MARRRFTTEQIITKLREAEVRLAQGKTVVQACKQMGITEQIYYRWRKEYGGLKMDQAKRLKALGVRTLMGGSFSSSDKVPTKPGQLHHGVLASRARYRHRIAPAESNRHGAAHLGGKEEMNSTALATHPFSCA